MPGAGKAGGGVTQSKELRVLVEPFRIWLLNEVRKHGFGLVADRCEVDERVLRRIAGTNTRWVSLSIVDQCLLNSPTNLEELYPFEKKRRTRSRKAAA